MTTTTLRVNNLVCALIVTSMCCGSILLLQGVVRSVNGPGSLDRGFTLLLVVASVIFGVIWIASLAVAISARRRVRRTSAKGAHDCGNKRE